MSILAYLQLFIPDSSKKKKLNNYIITVLLYEMFWQPWKKVISNKTLHFYSLFPCNKYHFCTILIAIFFYSTNKDTVFPLWRQISCQPITIEYFFNMQIVFFYQKNVLQSLYFMLLIWKTNYMTDLMQQVLRKTYFAKKHCPHTRFFLPVICFSYKCRTKSGMKIAISYQKHEIK